MRCLNHNPKDILPLPLSIFSLKRTGREGTGNTTCTDGFAWHFICDLQLSRSGKYLFVSWTVFFFGYSIKIKLHIAVTQFMPWKSGFYIDVLFTYNMLYMTGDPRICSNILQWTDRYSIASGRSQAPSASMNLSLVVFARSSLSPHSRSTRIVQEKV